MRAAPKKASGAGRTVYAAGALALTEPGPAAAGIVVADEKGRTIGARSHYLGTATRAEATAQALLAAARLALSSEMEAPSFVIDDPQLADSLRGAASAGREDGTMRALREVLEEIGEHEFEVVAPGANPARAAALAPLVEWLPERTRRAEGLKVRPLGECAYEVASESQPGQAYRVTLRPPGTDGQGDHVSCECGDFVHRGIPCKHLLAAAREVGALDQLFYPEPTAR